MQAASKLGCPESSRKTWLAIGAILLGAVAAYHKTFSVPLLFDDILTIKSNPSIHHLGALSSVLFPAKQMLTAGRPFLNLTFALNYAMGGAAVGGYHVFNLLIHIAAGSALFGIVRRTLLLPKMRENYGSDATLLALAVAIVWTLNPVQTESVTYITQRAESLMGLCYLLTLYCFIRAVQSPVPWAGLSILACALGMMSKEVMVSLPITALFYDRTFVAGSFRQAWQQRWRIYLGLASMWLVLAGLMTYSGPKHRGVGYGAGMTGWTYALTESKVVIGYLKLAVWPSPLIFDYGPTLMVNRVAQAAPYLLILGGLLLITLLTLRFWPSLGFLCAWFFLILGPTSSVVPLVGQPMAEHRLYLPLAAIASLEVAGLYALAGRRGLIYGLPAVLLALAILTWRRNCDYRSAIAIWTDTVQQCAGNPRAHNNLGEALADIPSRLPDAIRQYEAALEIEPNFAEAHNNLANALATIPGKMPAAIAHYETALRIKPDYYIAHYGLGMALEKLPGRLVDAVGQYQAALVINPDFAEGHDNLGNALSRMPGCLADAITQYHSALRLDPDNAEAHFNLAIALEKVPGRLAEALHHYEAALRINPAFAEAHNNFGSALSKLPGRLPEAIAQYKAALEIDPNLAEAHFNLGSALLHMAGRNQEAQAQLDAALRLRPALQPQVASLRTLKP